MTTDETKLSQRITITDLDMPFNSLIKLMIKVAFASIPALIIVSAVLAALGGVISVVLGLFGVVMMGL